MSGQQEDVVEVGEDELVRIDEEDAVVVDERKALPLGERAVGPAACTAPAAWLYAVAWPVQ